MRLIKKKQKKNNKSIPLICTQLKPCGPSQSGSDCQLRTCWNAKLSLSLLFNAAGVLLPQPQIFGMAFVLGTACSCCLLGFVPLGFGICRTGPFLRECCFILLPHSLCSPGRLDQAPSALGPPLALISARISFESPTQEALKEETTFHGSALVPPPPGTRLCPGTLRCSAKRREMGR